MHPLGLPCTRTWARGSGCCRWPYTGTWPARDTLNSWQAETSVQSLTPGRQAGRQTAQTTSSSVRRHSLTLSHGTLTGREGGRGGRSVGSVVPANRRAARLKRDGTLGPLDVFCVRPQVMHVCLPRLKRPSVAVQCHVCPTLALMICTSLSLSLSLSLPPTPHISFWLAVKFVLNAQLEIIKEREAVKRPNRGHLVYLLLPQRLQHENNIGSNIKVKAHAHARAHAHLKVVSGGWENIKWPHIKPPASTTTTCFSVITAPPVGHSEEVPEELSKVPKYFEPVEARWLQNVLLTHLLADWAERNCASVSSLQHTPMK